MLELSMVLHLAQSMPLPSVFPRCLPSEEMTKVLKATFDESPIFVGLGEDGAFAYVLYTSPAGTWTFTRIAAATNEECLVAAGRKWDLAIGPSDSET